MTHSLHRFDNLTEVYVGKDEHTAAQKHIEAVKYARGTIMVKLSSIDTRNDSDNVINHYLFVDKQQVVPPPAGSYFIHDIIGCTVYAENSVCGTVVEIFTRSHGLAQDVWVVEGNGRALWIPAIKDFVEKVDLDRRCIVVRRIEELLS